jgi:hypothetical protein
MAQSWVIAYSILPMWNTFNCSFILSIPYLVNIDDSLLDLRRVYRSRCFIAEV